MDTHLVNKINLLTFCFHPEKSHIFYIKYCGETKALIVFQEDLLTHGIINQF